MIRQETVNVNGLDKIRHVLHIEGNTSDEIRNAVMTDISMWECYASVMRVYYKSLGLAENGIWSLYLRRADVKRLASDGANKNIVALVQKAFEVDRQGHLSASKILGLQAYKIEDGDWVKAMEIIRQSMQVVGTKTYIRFYKKNAEGAYEQIALG